MRYRRKPTRPPRAVEDRALRQKVGELRETVATLCLELQESRERLNSSESIRDILQRDIGKLAVELRHERNKVDFLTGRDGLGHEPWDIRRIFG